MTGMTQAWTLVARPEGLPAREHFALRRFTDPPLRPGDVRVRNHWLTVGPAMRVRMFAQTRGYLPPFELGTPMAGWAVGEVVASRAAALEEGDPVLHQLGLRDFAQGPAGEFQSLPRPGPAPQHYLNALGSTGFTAYVGLILMARPRVGETLFVSGAAGAVGGVAVQIGKAIGLRVVGSAGGRAKCDLLGEIGADAAIDYKSPGPLIDKLEAAAPEGIDIYLDNVGGEHLDAALARANPHARFSISGMISSYNQERVAETMRHLNRIVTQRLRIEGYLPLTDHADGLPPFRDQMWRWIQAGQVRPLQTLRTGLASVPQAIQDLFMGGCTGKLLIRLPEDGATERWPRHESPTSGQE